MLDLGNSVSFAHSAAAGMAMVSCMAELNRFHCVFQGLQRRRESKNNTLYDPTDDLQKFDFQANFKPDTPLPGTPGTSSWSLETPLGHRTGPKPNFHGFFVFVLEPSFFFDLGANLAPTWLPT